jgi:hypothetical protein
MSDDETEVRDDGVDESGRNETQRRMDEEGVEAVPVDEEWQEEGPP